MEQASRSQGQREGGKKGRGGRGVGEGEGDGERERDSFNNQFVPGTGLEARP